MLLVIETGEIVAAPLISKVEADADEIVRVLPLAKVPVRFKVPPLAVIVPLPAAMFAATVPAPERVAPEPMVRPELSVSVEDGPTSIILPLVMLSAALMVKLPPLPISSVWLALLIAIALAVAAVLENSKVEAEEVAIVKVLPLATVPVKFNVPPLAVTVPVPARAAETVPEPVSVPPFVTVPEPASVPPDSVIVPDVLLIPLEVLSVAPLEMLT